jgi:AraC-like DNA-binding protein
MDPCRLHAFGHWAAGNTERPNLKVRHEHPFAYGVPVLKLRGMFFHVLFRAVERTLSAKPLQVVIAHPCTPIWHISNTQFTNQIGAEKHGLAAAKRARKRRRRPAPADHHSGISPVKLSIAETARLAGLARQHTAGLITRARLTFALRWSVRGRLHQAIARWHHYSARLLAAGTG